MKEYLDQNFILPISNGVLVEEYEVLQCIGRGGFGTTYLCHDKNLNRKCVIKEYTPQRNAFRNSNSTLSPILFEEYNRGLREFLLEAQNLALFNHPNIVKINRYFEANSTGYLVMDFESGESLRSIIQKRQSSFEEFEIESIIIPLCDGLEQLHKNHLIHRDINPENIVVKSNGSPILIDFGAVGNLKIVDEKDYKIYITPHYAPIEQYDTMFPQGNWIDIYALGATMYEMIAGFPPPHALSRIENDSIESIKEIGRGKYGIQLLELIERSLNLDYQERPQSLREFLNFYHFDKFKTIRYIAHSIIGKAINHFLNFTKPNNGLVIDEFVSFIVGFSVLDMTWRIGNGRLLDSNLYDKIVDSKIVDESLEEFKNAGFKTQKMAINPITIKSRLEEYAATYLLDRQEENWNLRLTSKQCAMNCITDEFSNEREMFKGLLEEVVDRYRFRIKRELDKLYY